ncbi:MAG: 4Fe-4S dicluster protein [Bacteriovoracaceae bacterium]|nr:4Fe-4S dicluster protein [Bacteriovoracaceae bacterium]
MSDLKQIEADRIEMIRKDEEKVLTSERRKLWQAPQQDEASWEVIKADRSKEFSPNQKEDSPESHDESLLNPSRRRFLQWMGATTALMTSSACKTRPVDTLVPYVHKPQGFVMGVPVWYASTASNGYGILVKTREGRPIKVEGNSDHPFNRGGLDASTQACLLDLYNPERVKKTLQNQKESSWKETDAAIKGALKSARAGSVRVLTGSIHSPSLRAALDSFLSVYNAKQHITYPFGRDVVSDAHSLGKKDKVSPSFSFDKADVIVSFDEDFLGSHPSAVAFTKDFSKRRKIHHGDTKVNRLFVFESNFTLTGVNADHRYSIAPSDQLSAIYAIAHLVSQKSPTDASVKTFLNDYSSEKISGQIGVSEENLKEVADALLSAKGKAIVLAGGNGPDALAVQSACILLNQMLGSFSNTITLSSSEKGAASSESYESLLKDAEDGNVDVLIVHGQNPVYHQASGEFDRALSKIKTLIVVSQDLNETASKAQFVLGESHFLESWGDYAFKGVSIQQPVIEPLFETRSFGEILLSLAQNNAVDYRVFVQNLWKKNYFRGVGSFDAWWSEQLRLGTTASSSHSDQSVPKITSLRAPSKSKTDALELVLYETAHLRDGTQASNAWLQELPDAISKVTWSNYVAVSLQLARKIGFREDLTLGHHANDVALVKVGDKSLELPVHIQPGLKANVIAIALGYGRTAAGSVGTNVGKNAAIFSRRNDDGSVQLSGIAASISKTGKTYALATTQRHFELQGRDKDILQHATLAEFLKDPKVAKEGEKEEKPLSMYNEQEFVYPGHKWGMSIDLNSCTGCQACVVACYSENNIAVSGEDQIRKGRHMAWLRMDLYYSGAEDNPDTANIEPMLCQQCTNAPCETVCPVLATTHSSDGLNDMVYNRCVGTRYCANNCPYKVRRFNYFNYSESLGSKIDMIDPLPMSLNPDVTVRSRGVMEKCTFCVQRIRRTVDEVKDKKEKLKDGAIQTACQQSCPADAIVFGDLNDPESQVSKLAATAQSFKVLEVLNTRPSVSYLPRIRNKGTS